MYCFGVFAHFSQFSMYAWGEKRKNVSFSRVYVCVKAKLTFVSFFFLFIFLHLSLIRTIEISSTGAGFLLLPSFFGNFSVMGGVYMDGKPVYRLDLGWCSLCQTNHDTLSRNSAGRFLHLDSFTNFGIRADFSGDGASVQVTFSILHSYASYSTLCSAKSFGHLVTEQSFELAKLWGLFWGVSFPLSQFMTLKHLDVAGSKI